MAWSVATYRFEMVTVQFTLLLWLSVATFSWAQSCALKALDTDTTVAVRERAEVNERYEHGDEAAYRCRPDYKQKSPLPDYRYATCAAGTWQYPGDPLICVQDECERPKDPAHGKVIIIKNTTTVGSIVLFSCDHGDQRFSARCLTGGIWSHSPPTCPEKEAGVNCERLGDPARGKAIYHQNKTTVGSTVVFKCNYGSIAYNAKCLPGGHWDKGPPVCPEASCERLRDLPHGKVIYVNNDTTVGSTIIFRCNYGTTAYSATCLARGVWSENPPICQAPPPSEKPKVTAATTTPRSKERKECPPLRDLLHGRLLNNGSGNSSVVFVCDEGYVLQGSSTMVCRPDGTWDPQQLPVCRTSFPWVIVASVAATFLVILAVGLVCVLRLCRRHRRRPTGYRRQIRKPSLSDSHTQNEVAHLHKPYPVTSL